MKGALFFMFALGAALSATWSTSACRSSCSLAASDYDRSCTQDSDCVGISEGDVCSAGCTNCVNAAINVRDQAKYESDLSGKVGAGRVCPCPFARVACNAGACGIAPFYSTPADGGTVDATMDGVSADSAAAQEGVDATSEGDDGSCLPDLNGAISRVLDVTGGVLTGGPNCGACAQTQCCTQLTACDTPDDAGVDPSGFTACGEVLRCTLLFVSGAGGRGPKGASRFGDASALYDVAAVACGGFAGAPGNASAEAAILCVRNECATDCSGL